METGVIILHGFTGGSFEVRPFVQYLKEKTDWIIDIPVLPGHEPGGRLTEISAEAWLMEAELAYRRLSKRTDRIFVVGFSMGGLIALYLALRYPVERLILLSAAAKYISPRQLLADAAILLSEPVIRHFPPNTFYHLYRYKLANTPIRSAYQFTRIVQQVEPYYDRITVPVCIVQGKQDGIVPYSSAHLLYHSLGSNLKQLIFSDTGKHHICYSADCAEWFEKVLAFMQAKDEQVICLD
ncbi:alpha/beta hydrolase [Sporosarcina gallistercoris]|uniref:Alpha/beta fold hydrolase n=1 Tax=Sporosarcina gallistercoris TaxID=2762245 RepID=A0ABR8PGS9_9BACL|nr:alpha/beta fold hydrolase [Sporosarcina gallistercoris]MBD7907369.1 alpha/beta fold hydrolase [Sporosarcina gallistercoris]